MRTLQFIFSLIYSAGFMLLLNLSSYGQQQTAQVTPKDTSFDAFLVTFEQAINNFVNGDLTVWKQLCSQSDDATILGGFGGYEKGWNQVGPRYDWASSQFKAGGSKKRIEYISKIMGEKLAYTITIERAELLLAGQEKPVSEVLRVTQIFRKEDGIWKLLHRHADPFLEKKAPVATSKNKN